MQIKKKELIEALEIAKKFTSHDGLVTEKVLFDSGKQRIVATDFYAWAFIGLNMESPNYVKAEAKHENWPEEDFRADLMTLKKAQLENLAGYAGIEVAGTKAEITEVLIRESLIAADEELYKKEAKYLDESFLVDPNLLLNAVKTLVDETVEIKGQDYRQVDDDESEKSFNVPSWINIHGYFKGIMATSPGSFPDDPPMEPGSETQFRCNLFQSDLEFIGQIKANKTSMADWHHFTKFGAEEIISTDGNRLHMIKRNCGNSDFFIKKKFLQKLGPIAKDEPFEVRSNESALELRLSKKSLSIVVNLETDIAYPETKVIMSMASHNVTARVTKTTWEKMIDQAIVLNDTDYKGIVLKFNSGMTVESVNPVKGEYGRRFDYADEGYEVEPSIMATLNGAYLKNLPVGQNMTFHLSENENSVVFVEIDKERIAAIMPMRM
jgi:hypothetical protein